MEVIMNGARSRDTGRLALAVGSVTVASAGSLATYFAVGGLFGTLNDVGNAAVGILTACLAWRLRAQLPGLRGRLATGVALAGGVLTVAGSALVISGTTTFLLAGLVSSLGFAGIGAWLVLVSRRALATRTWPRRVAILGGWAGAVMAVGVAVAPGIALRIDDLETAPSWIWIGFVGWLGIFVLYPVWAISLGLVETRLTPPVLGARETAVID
jgi:MFS family permease